MLVAQCTLHISKLWTRTILNKICNIHIESDYSSGLNTFYSFPFMNVFFVLFSSVFVVVHMQIDYSRILKIFQILFSKLFIEQPTSYRATCNYFIHCGREERSEWTYEHSLSMFSYGSNRAVNPNYFIYGVNPLKMN